MRCITYPLVASASQERTKPITVRLVTFQFVERPLLVLQPSVQINLLVGDQVLDAVRRAGWDLSSPSYAEFAAFQFSIERPTAFLSGAARVDDGDRPPDPPGLDSLPRGRKAVLESVPAPHRVRLTGGNGFTISWPPTDAEAASDTIERWLRSVLGPAPDAGTDNAALAIAVEIFVAEWTAFADAAPLSADDRRTGDALAEMMNEVVKCDEPDRSVLRGVRLVRSQG